MNIEKSCGAILYTISNHQLIYLIIQSVNGHYGFPKGHMENNETEMETALREIKEEVGLDIELNSNFKVIEAYCLPNITNTQKTVTYFLSEFYSDKINFSKNEIKSVQLLAYEDAYQLLNHESSKKVLKEANDYLVNLEENV